MMNAGLPVGRWRAFIKYEIALRGLFLKRFFKNVFALPKREYLFLALSRF